MGNERWAGSPAVPLQRAADHLGVPLDSTARTAAKRFPLRFPQHYLDLVRASDPEDPMRRIGWPDPAELEPDPDAIEDPVGETSLLIHPLVIQKYPNRVILLVTSRCHFYCRFCFRAGHRKDPSAAEIEAAISSIERIDGVKEVILSGGDPLVLPDEPLESILARLSAVPGLDSLRIHTRAPVHDPDRVTEDLARALTAAARIPLWFALHVTHPRELTPAFERAVTCLREAGGSLASQTVLLRGVNDDVETLAELFGGLYSRRVVPIYLHHPDRVRGTAHFRLTIEEGRRIYRGLRGKLAGPAIPQYVVDLPDGSGKVPVDWLEADGPGCWSVELPDGRRSRYVDIGWIRRSQTVGSGEPGPSG